MLSIIRKEVAGYNFSEPQTEFVEVVLQLFQLGEGELFDFSFLRDLDLEVFGPLVNSSYSRARSAWKRSTICSRLMPSMTFAVNTAAEPPCVRAVVASCPSSFPCVSLFGSIHVPVSKVDAPAAFSRRHIATRALDGSAGSCVRSNSHSHSVSLM